MNSVMSHPAPVWWQTAHWRQRLQQHLWVRSRRRYTLELSTNPPLAATMPRQRRVHIQPEGIPFPTDHATLALIRHAPRSPLLFQQAICWMLIEHESAHCRFSGAKPAGELLGWLWNVLEDARIERIMAALYPELAQGFTMLGDAVWTQLSPTGDLLSGCLYHRFEHTRPPRQGKFHPAPEGQALWDTMILPLVQAAWHAADSDQVTAIAQQILHHLHRDAEAPPPDLPVVLCGCDGGGARQHPDLPVPSREPAPAGGFFLGDSDRTAQVLVDVEDFSLGQCSSNGGLLHRPLTLRTVQDWAMEAMALVQDAGLSWGAALRQAAEDTIIPCACP